MMKKAFMFVILALFLVSGVIATTSITCADKDKKGDKDNNGFNNECQKYFNDKNYFPLAKFDYNGHGYTLIEQSSDYDSYTIDVSGTSKKADWTSNPNVYSVLVTEGKKEVQFNGGLSGTITSNRDNISHITFCAKKTSGGGTGGVPSGVPEFSLLTMGIAVIAVSLGLVFLRKN